MNYQESIAAKLPGSLTPIPVKAESRAVTRKQYKLMPKSNKYRKPVPEI